MDKKLVFISHITEETEIALALKDLVETSFLGMINVFVSGEDDAILMGSQWLDRVSSAVESCEVEIVLCSNISVRKPWINFEAGAGWARGIILIPLCHSGLEPSKLPIPLTMRQGARAMDENGVKRIFTSIAKLIGASVPAFDFTEFLSKVSYFEKRYTFWSRVNSAFGYINKLNPDIIRSLKNGTSDIFDFAELQMSGLTPHLELLSDEEIVDHYNTGYVSHTGTGTFYCYRFSGMAKFEMVVQDANFNPAAL